MLTIALFYIYNHRCGFHTPIIIPLDFLFFMLHTITAAETQAKGLKERVEPDAGRNSMR